MLEYTAVLKKSIGSNKIKVGVIREHLETAQRIANTMGVKNLFYNEQYIELMVADLLDHEYNRNTRGADAYDEGGNKVEYKTINLSTTSRGSFQFHWLSKDKLNSYGLTKDVYFILRHDLVIDEIWKLPMNVIFSDLEKKYKEAEVERFLLNVAAGSNRNKNINAHKSYSLNKVKKLGAVLVYQKEAENSVGV
jgi:hypothetical protein